MGARYPSGTFPLGTFPLGTYPDNVFGPRDDFAPTDIPGLLLWLDPTFGRFKEITGVSATTPAVASNDPWGTYLAQTGQYFTSASAAAPDNRPKLLFGANGKPYAKFNGLNDGTTSYWNLSTGSVITTEPRSLMANVLYANNSTTVQCLYLGKAAGGNGIELKVQDGGINKMVAGIAAIVNYAASNTLMTVGNWYRLGVTLGSPVGAGKCNYRLNGANDGSVASSGSSQTGTPRVGAGGTVANEPFGGGLGDLLLYDHVLTAGEQASLDAWMLTRLPN